MEAGPWQTEGGGGRPAQGVGDEYIERTKLVIVIYNE